MDEVDAAYELAARVFGPNYFAASATKVRLRAVDPVRHPDEAIVVMSDGDVVGFVRLVSRAVWLGGESLTVGGVTSVCVHPRVQKLGYGRLVMEEALAVSRARGDVLSIAFARRAVDGFYPRLGYVGIGCHPELLVPAASPGGDGTAPEVTRGFDAGEAAGYAAAYRATYGSVPLAFARDATWWAIFPRRMEGRVALDDFHTVRAGGRAIGYFIAPGGRVIEAACLDGAESVLERALASVSAGRDLVLALAPAHPALSPWRRRNHTERVRYAWDGGHVVRVLNGDRFAGALRVAAGGDDAGARGGDLRDHEGARAVLERVAGVAGARRLIPLPAWSPVDEF
jgi:GNAT superfamily N-acetyltransferase